MVKNVITNKMETPEKQDCLRVILALSNDDAPVSGPCPDPNDMAAFVDGTIKRKKSKEMGYHRCRGPLYYTETRF